MSTLAHSLSLLNTDLFTSYSNTCTYKHMIMHTALHSAVCRKVRIYSTIHCVNLNILAKQEGCHSKEIHHALEEKQKKIGVIVISSIKTLKTVMMI